MSSSSSPSLAPAGPTGVLLTRAIAIDSFGNVQLDAEHDQLADTGLKLGRRVAVSGARGDAVEAQFARTFADVPRGELLVYEDAQRRLAIAVSQGSAADRLGVAVDDELEDRPGVTRGHDRLGGATLGHPRVHLRVADSTNARARELAVAGAPHGTIVTAGEQSAGRGRQGRTWSGARGRSLLCSVVVRELPRLMPLAAGVAVAEVVGAAGARSSGPTTCRSRGSRWPASSSRAGPRRDGR